MWWTRRNRSNGVQSLSSWVGQVEVRAKLSLFPPPSQPPTPSTPSPPHTHIHTPPGEGRKEMGGGVSPHLIAQDHPIKPSLINTNWVVIFIASVKSLAPAFSNNINNLLDYFYLTFWENLFFYTSLECKKDKVKKRLSTLRNNKTLN